MSDFDRQKAVSAVGSQFDLVLIAARRARELKHGWSSKLEGDTGPLLTALCEIQAGLVGRDYLNRPANIGRHERPDD